MRTTKDKDFRPVSSFIEAWGEPVFLILLGGIIGLGAWIWLSISDPSLEEKSYATVFVSFILADEQDESIDTPQAAPFMASMRAGNITRFVVADNATEFWSGVEEALVTLGEFHQLNQAFIDSDWPSPGEAVLRLMETKIEMAGIPTTRKDRYHGQILIKESDIVVAIPNNKPKGDGLGPLMGHLQEVANKGIDEGLDNGFDNDSWWKEFHRIKSEAKGVETTTTGEPVRSRVEGP